MVSNDDIIIRVENLTAGYRSETVLRDVSFDVRRGEVFVIMGSSGCGKSTLMKHMFALHEPMAGRVLIDGEDIAAAVGEERRRILEKVGVGFQTGALLGSMSVIENVCLPLEVYTDLPLEAKNLIACMKLKLVGLEDYGDYMPSEISGGMRKRVAIARAIVRDPDIVFLDEPSAGLDPVTSAEIDALIVRLARSLGITFVVVSHELASIHHIADRVIMLDKKEQGIIAEGRPEELRDRAEDPRVRKFFNPDAALNATA